MCEKHNDVVDEEVIETLKCNECSGEIPKEDSIEIDNCDYCIDCVSLCEDCGENCIGTHSVQDRRYNEIRVCESCRDNNYHTCEDCDVEFSINAIHGNDNNGDIVCESCGEEYFSCDSCGETYHNDDYSSDGRCMSCDNESEPCDIVNSCCYKPIPKFFPSLNEGPYFMGVELETESEKGSREDNAYFVRKQLGDFAYMKEDGSLDNGFEIVTHPATLSEHKKRWLPLLDNSPSELGSYKHDSCGLHIHASRKHLSQLTIGEILAFINAANNKKFVTTLAQRESNGYAEIKTKKIKDVKYPYGKYEALNLTNSDTIEFRIFKGNLAKDKLFRALEFVEAIIKFCERGNNSINDCVRYTKFIEYVYKNKKEYPELNNYCLAFNMENQDE